MFDHTSLQKSNLTLLLLVSVLLTAGALFFVPDTAHAQTCNLLKDKAINNGVGRTQVNLTGWSGQTPTLGTLANQCETACEGVSAQLCGLEYFHVESETSCSGQGRCVGDDTEWGEATCYSYTSGSVINQAGTAKLGGGCGPEECTEIWTFTEWYANTCTLPAPAISVTPPNPLIISCAL